MPNEPLNESAPTPTSLHLAVGLMCLTALIGLLGAADSAAGPHRLIESAAPLSLLAAALGIGLRIRHAYWLAIRIAAWQLLAGVWASSASTSVAHMLAIAASASITVLLVQPATLHHVQTHFRRRNPCDTPPPALR